MKIHVLSDIHAEGSRWENKEYWLPKYKEEADVVILAGDIDYINCLEKTLKVFSDMYKHVIYITGNHEFYGTLGIAPKYAHQKFILEKEFPSNVRILQGSSVEIEGQHILGGNFWYPWDSRIPIYRVGIPEFHVVSGIDTVHEIYEEGYKYLIENVRRDSIVVTHHLPHRDCIHWKFKTSEINFMFFSDFTQVIEENRPKLWIHGHTHETHDILVEETRIICNPAENLKPSHRYKPKVISV